MNAPQSFAARLPAQAPIAHGGALDDASRAYPDAPRPWLDLSTGVSPRAYPFPAPPTEAWTRLPDRDAVARLEALAARAYCVADGAEVVAGAGTQAFIKALPRVFPAKRAATLGFTYAEHAACWSGAGALVHEAQELGELAQADAAVVVNPNNPDGRVCAPQDLAALARRMARRGGLLVVDEAFVDFAPQFSVAPLVAGNLVVLRSFGKAYGLPGARLGFALCAPPLAEALRAELGPWSVSGPALAVGAAALADADWLEESRVALEVAARRLDALLLAAGFDPVGGTSLYRLARSGQAARWFERLCARGVLTRRFAERVDWLRFGLPATQQDWERLATALGVAADV